MLARLGPRRLLTAGELPPASLARLPVKGLGMWPEPAAFLGGALAPTELPPGDPLGGT